MYPPLKMDMGEILVIRGERVFWRIIGVSQPFSATFAAQLHGISELVRCYPAAYLDRPELRTTGRTCNVQDVQVEYCVAGT
jgi:hypothetical protein